MHVINLNDNRTGGIFYAQVCKPAPTDNEITCDAVTPTAHRKHWQTFERQNLSQLSALLLYQTQRADSENFNVPGEILP